MLGKRILITGATGFVGQSLVKKLMKDNNHTLATVTRNRKKSTELFGNNIQHILFNSDEFEGNVADFSPQIVVHLASFSTSLDDPKNIKTLVEGNILFISLLLNALKTTNVEVFLNTGTFAEYFYNDGEFSPAYYYAATKTAARSILAYYKSHIGMKCCTVVPYTIYGGTHKNKKVIDIIFDSLFSNTLVKMTRGEQVLDYIHLNDVIDFYVHILNNSHLLAEERDYHLGFGSGVGIKDLARLIENVSEKKTNINWGAHEYRPNDIMRAIAPVFRLEKELNWAPKIDIETGVAMTWFERCNRIEQC